MQLEKKIFSGKFSDPNKMAKWTKPKNIKAYPSVQMYLLFISHASFPNKLIKVHMGKIEEKRVQKITWEMYIYDCR